jgi:hypothetical protein
MSSFDRAEYCTFCSLELEQDPKFPGGLLCKHCDRVWHMSYPPSKHSVFPLVTTPPKPFRRESLLPPRALPAAGSAATLIGAAVVAAYQIPDPLSRALVMLGCGVTSWLIGYFTQPPRRHFREGHQ